MESGALRGRRPRAGIPFRRAPRGARRGGRGAARELGVIDEATGEVRAGRALAAMALHPRLWPAAARLARQQRSAARRLGAIMAALEVEAIAAPPRRRPPPASDPRRRLDAISAPHRDRHDEVAAQELVGGQPARAGRAHAGAAPHLQPRLHRLLPERYTGDLKDRLPLSKCFAAVDECGAPVVSVCGGEPTVYPRSSSWWRASSARKKHVIMCTNAILLDRFYKKARPHKRLSINVHLDGMQKTHDYVVDRTGVFDKAVAMIKEGKRLGYYVCTNTTVYRETDVARSRRCAPS